MTYNEETTDDVSWADDLDVDTVEGDYVSPLASGDYESVDEDADPEELVNEDLLDASDDFDFSDEASDDSDFEISDETETSDDDFSDFEISGEEDSPVEGVIVLAEETHVADLDVPQPLSVEEAKELTEHIRSTADVLYVLVARAHAGKAHIALGYKNFESYVKEEFNISRSRAYQFLNQANVIAAIESVTPDGTQIRISEAAARDLKNFVNELAPELKERTEGLSPDAAGEVVEDLVTEFRERSKKPIDEDNDFDIDDIDLDDIDFDLPEFGNEGSTGGGGSEFDNMEDFDNLDDLLNDTDNSGFDEDPSSFRQKVEHVYAFYTALTSLEKMPDVSEIINAIPEARRPHIDASLPKALAWLTAANEAWEAQKSGISNEDEDFDSNDAEGVREDEELVETNDYSDDFTDIEDEH
jgi:hypothetical protein